MCFIISKKLAILAATTVIIVVLLLVKTKVGLTQTVATSCESEDELQDKKTIYLFLMVSYPDPLGRKALAATYDDGHELAPAAYLAVEQINNRSDLLHGYKLKLIHTDGGCDVTTRTVISFTKDIVLRSVPVAGIIGPSCLPSVDMVSQLIKEKRINNLLSVAYYGDPTLQNSLFGLLDRGPVYSEAYLHLVLKNNWKRVAILVADNKLYFSLLHLENNTDYKVVFEAPLYENYIPLESVQESFVRVIFVFAPPQITRRLLCLAYHAGMVYPNYQWIFYEHTEYDFFGMPFSYDGKHFECSTAEIYSALKGSLNIFEAFIPETDTTKTFSGLTYPQFLESYKSQIEKYMETFNVTSQESYWANPVYDATWTLALALNFSLKELEEKNITFSKDDLNRQAEITNIIQKNMFNVDFKGITSHRIKFDRKTRLPEETIIDIFIYNGSSMGEIIGKYRSESRSLTLSLLSLDNNLNKSMTFIDYKFETKFDHLSIATTAIFLSLAIGGVLLAIATQVFNTAYCNHKSVKASSHKLNHIIFVGCYIVILGIVLYTIRKTLVLDLQTHTIFCNLFPICCNIGLELIIATVCVKTWRLYALFRIFGKPKIRFLFKDRTLSCMIGFLLLVEAMVLTVWMVFEPLQAYEKTHLKDFNQDVRMKVTSIQCLSSWTLTCISLLGTYKGMLLLLSLVFAILTRKTSRLKQFATNSIVILVYLLSIVIAIALPIYLIVIINSDNSTVRFLVVCISLCTAVYICLLVLFLPSISPVIKDKIISKLSPKNSSSANVVTSLACREI